jgi:hypothetical protein
MATKNPFKINRTVRFTRRNGVVATGRISAQDHSNGPWVLVNTAEKGKAPKITKVRPSQLQFV